MENRMKSLFGTYAEQLQVLVDTNLDKFKDPLWNKYFSLGIAQTGLTYATAIGRSRIEAAASVVAHGSEAPLRSRAALERLNGEVASIKVKRKMDESEYRNWLTVQAMNVSDEAKKTQLIQLIWDDVKYVVDSVNARLDYMTAQALSTGYVKISADTNPDGVIPGNIDMMVKARWATNSAFNTSSASNRLWTDTNRTTATPLTDIRYLTRLAYKDYGIAFGKMLMSPEKLWILLNNQQVQQHLAGSVGIVSGQDALYSLNNLNGYLAGQGLPIIELVDVRTGIEKSGVITTVDPWEDKKYIAFVPSGNLGIIHNALAVEQISPVASVNYATANNILVSKWAQTEPFGEYTRGEIAAFPGLEQADNIIIANTEHLTTF
jgi:hypothetical protein